METTKPINQNKKKRPRRSGTETGYAFLKAKSSNIPLPVEVEDVRENIVKWGKNNLYPYYLNYLAKNNPMHSGILRSKRYFTVSGGLQYDGADVEAWNAFYQNGKQTHKDKNLDELQWDMSLNYEKSNMFCYLIMLNRVGERQLRKVKEIPFEKIRFEIEQKGRRVVLTGNIKVSPDWSDKDITPHTIRPYDPSDETQKKFYVLYQEESGQSLDTAKAKKVNPGVYPDPPYGGGITAIDTGIEINEYNNSEIYNGFSIGTVLNLNNGKPKNEEDQKDLEKGISESSTGASQAGRSMVLYNNGKDREASVINLNGNNLPDRYTNTKKGTEESICHAHSVTSPILFGVKQEGSLGNATELLNGYIIMQKNYFEARRAALLSILNWIGKTFAGLQGSITFGEVVLDFPEMFEEKSVTVNVGEVKQSKDISEILLGRFKTVGRPRSDFKVLHSRSFTDYDNPSPDAVVTEFKQQFQTLGDNELQALNLINEGQDFDSIRKALNVSGTDLATIYRRLQNLEMISDTGELLDEGARELAAADIDKMEILFEYRLRADAPALLPGGESREFCQNLLAVNRLYTLSEIGLISGVEGYDVFRFRGGWYHNPVEDRNEPGCRHEWAQVITFR